MPSSLAQRQASIDARLMEVLEATASLSLDLSEDDSLYDLQFLSDRLAKVSVYQERLSDFQLEVTKINIEVSRAKKSAEFVSRLKEMEIRGSVEFKALPRDEKTTWIESKLADDRSAAEEWSKLSFVVSEVKEAVSDRMGTMRRLDSDLRLHSQLFEAKVKAGIIKAPQFGPGTGNSEVTLD